MPPTEKKISLSHLFAQSQLYFPLSTKPHRRKIISSSCRDRWLTSSIWRSVFSNFFQMEMNLSNVSMSLINDALFNKYIRLTNFALLCSGFLFNLFLFVILLAVGRRECTTYFLLILMTLCDCLYCLVHLAITLTVDQYINIINHQILCPLSFFLTPFTFTGSILLLLICLVHFITNYVRKYDTTLGQIGGRLSFVFVLAFIIIRSVLGSTSVELVSLDQSSSDLQYCTIDLNTPTIVETVQNITHIFAEVTDILVYLGWIAVALIYLVNLIRCKESYFYDQRSVSIVKPVSYASLLIVHNNPGDTTRRESLAVLPIESTEILNTSHETGTTAVTNKQKHCDVSLIVLTIAFVSIFFYLPIMISKYSTMFLAYRGKPLFSDRYTALLQILQHTAHLFCLSFRFVPYFLFDKRIRKYVHQLVGMQCVRMDSQEVRSRRRNYKRKRQYLFRCQCHRRQRVLSTDQATRESEPE